MLCELLLARTREAWFADAAAAVELAELAVVVSDRLDRDHYGESLVEDARARACAYLANALRQRKVRAFRDWLLAESADERRTPA